MAQVALDPAYRRMSVEEFLALDLRGAKAELEDGLLYMMTGGSEAHSRNAVSGDEWLELGRDLILNSIGVTIPHDEIFADD